ncbi:PTS sugar transporter subunit IIA [Neobacillus sp. MM2021_6]|uniref:PTS fructose transporter subunit IIABC n=1 Tax=Bacillaceae TaxID=186817 RepID=UPI001408FEA0|nr:MULTISPECIES: PTS fructose transporter subunit IIABC [Bacillaceae]MBO0958350.1 PTS sugar transporter subunit IIA [Neobacillus sp. MM2021_6]NHC17950.1 PTS transporter subunit EIIA [Bacillus sp. MM2020_4]
MKITELLSENTILLNIKGNEKESTIDQLVEVLLKADKISDPKDFKAAIVKREEQSTTGIGDGIAIPHAKTKAVKEAAIVFGKSSEGVNYESLDGKPAHLFFMIAAPDGANNTHLEALARLSGLLMKVEVRYELLMATTAEEVMNTINRFDKDEEEAPATKDNNQTVVAVTGCPTGIAHTYMAADSLKAKAKEMDVTIKVETNGSGGAKNILTKEEIEHAAAVIVAADISVEMERFKGKHVIQAPVADGIRRPEQLIDKALKQDAPVYQGNGAKSTDDPDQKSPRKGFYKHLMNGVSNMLPFVVGGGILIAISFMFGYNSANPDDPSYNPIAAVIKAIGGDNAFALIVPVLAGFIALSIADRPGFAPGMVGGMMAASGGAGFLGGLIAGFLAGYMVLLLKKLFAGLPRSLEGIKSILIYPLLGIAITGFLMHYVVNNPVAWINKEIADWLTGLGTGNAVLLGIVLGLMMSFDMGGPINKAAYVFGTGLLASGVYGPMAAIMAAGMVPPLAIAIATTVFKNKFNEQDKDAGKACYVMGLSFITEGAIPFAAADPLRVIPSVMVGSAIAGALSMAFGIGLRAPHGGIFVVPLVDGGALLYALAILIGSVVSALLIGFLKKPVKSV